MVDATEIFHDLCWLLECEMATYEGAKDIKRTSKYDLKRHEGIINSALNKVIAYCRDYGFGIDPRNGRVKEAIEALQKELA